MSTVRCLAPFLSLALIVAACAPASAPTQAPAAPTTAAPAAPATAPPAAPGTKGPEPTTPPKPKSAVPFRWLFGFRIQANPSTAAIVIAKDQGFYAEQGINLEWDTATDQTSLRLIATGQYQAGSVGGPGTVVDMVSEGLPLIAVAIINQEGSRTFAVRSDSSIRSPKDFEGKKVGIKVSPWPEYLCLLKENGVDRSKIQEVSIGFSSVELKEGIVDVLPIFKSNEPLTLRKMGLDIRTIDPASFGCGTWGTTLVVNKQYANEHPGVIEGWLKATLKGLQFYSENKAKALEIVQKYSPEGVTPELNEFIYSVEEPQLWTADTRKFGAGWMTQQQWDREVDRMYAHGVIKSRPPTSDLMTTRFLERVYKDGKLVWP